MLQFDCGNEITARDTNLIGPSVMYTSWIDKVGILIMYLI